MTAEEADRIIYFKSHDLTLQKADKRIRLKTDAKIVDGKSYLMRVETEARLRSVANERATQ